MKKFSVLLMVLIGFGLMNHSAVSEEKAFTIPERVTLDGYEFKREELVSSFIDAAFSSFSGEIERFPENAMEVPYRVDRSVANSFYEPVAFKENYPWLYEYIFRSMGTPRVFSINKWKNPILVSMGYPNDLEPMVRKDASKDYLADVSLGKVPSGVKTAVEEEVSVLIPSISKATNLPAAYIDHKTETPTQIANIRIVLVNDVSKWASSFKKGNKTSTVITGIGASDPILFRDQVEPLLKKTAIPFTAYSDKQVDGYFLMDSENEIKQAFCFIWQGHPLDMLKGLVRECVIRSLGFAGAVEIAPYSVMSLWNDAKKWSPYYQKKLQSFPAKTTEFDLFLIRLLYQDILKPGMSPNQAYGEIIKNLGGG